MEAPVYPRAIIGYRVWRIVEDRDDTYLKAVWRDKLWQPGINRAVCPHGHQQPQEGCHCGFNMFYYYQTARDYRYASKGENILGIIAGRGHVQAHYSGCRAEEGQILALVVPHPLKRLFWPFGRQSQLVERLAEKYNVPVFNWPHQLRKYGKQMNGEVPSELRQQAGSLEEYFMQEYTNRTTKAGIGLVVLAMTLAWWLSVALIIMNS